MGELIVLRHGETEWSRTGRHTGRTDVPLSAHGEDQARGLLPALRRRGVVRTFVSPAKRAGLTARLAGLRGAEVDADLWEWDYGAYEGRTTEQIRQGRPPGGGLDHGEDPLAAVVREVTEETGYECAVDRLLGVEGRRVRFTRKPPVDMHAVRVFYEAHVVGGELRHEKNGSTDRAEWFDLDAVADLIRSELVDRGLRYLADRPATGNLG
ncbi:MAG: NUDIX domain-containing protein [Streptosporangiales bacterium]|nr:NUDIX domain-containing protein [Streptosporangiales bacterium]